ncbi:MAG: MBL fold metallo-hydrolase [Candidatus Eremiobacteraeota bacterium]|nr:MBL fold metallo-hydrolase [Candidatus Eremiobacteraeota bacterium]MBV8435083.1 MBL fold metallo-hydrolase [Candidatus Eremiobacteraeota bacterium]MBV8583231.1 MBL fold metallo-hydrolase [Candidatus Eremiobacteraeota bacterium]
MVTLVRAPNPSAMTLTGTNSYVVDCGAGQALVIDPGPPIDAHVNALIETAKAKDLHVAAIALTHGHPDHAPAARPLANATGAPVYAHPGSSVKHDRDLALEGHLRVGDLAFGVIDAPGHTFDHVVFYLPPERALFTGDVILGEGTVVIAPPGGAMRPYQHTLQRLEDEFGEARTIYGGHGPVVEDAQAKIREYIEHRRARERELLAALAEGEQTIPELVLRIYGENRPVLWPAMARQMLAYLIALEGEHRVASRRLDRAMTDRERWILNPPLEQIVGPEQAEVIAAELGSMLYLDALIAYRAIDL